jgi:hypothetical protein
VLRGGSELKGGIHAFEGAVHLQGDVVGAHARLGLDVEEGIELLGVREIDGAAAHGVGVALEIDAAAIDLRAPEDDGGGIAPLAG